MYQSSHQLFNGSPSVSPVLQLRKRAQRGLATCPKSPSWEVTEQHGTTSEVLSGNNVLGLTSPGNPACPWNVNPPLAPNSVLPTLVHSLLSVGTRLLTSKSHVYSEPSRIPGVLAKPITASQATRRPPSRGCTD